VWERNPEQVGTRLEDLRRLTRGALAEMRSLLLELRPAALRETPLSQLLRQLVEASMARTTIDAQLTVQGDARDLPTDVQAALYRLVQECINNITKHAQAQHANVRLVWADAYLCLEISDDGRGFDPLAIPAGHLGIGFMRERAAAIDASLRIQSQAGLGTTVSIRWPGQAADAEG
jgi:signal transduction histidine kinase